MKITFLGTGTSQGVPMIACPCAVCHSTSAKDKRLRSSVWIQEKDTSLVIDSGPDFRFQMLRAGVKRLDALVFTHGHKDHTAGMDDIRAFNYWQQEAIDIYASLETQEILKREFQYVFNGVQYPGIPQLNLHEVKNNEFIKVKNLTLQPIRTLHYRLEVFGFRMGNFTYITDANHIDDQEIEKIKGTEVLVLNALRFEKHISHFSVPEAIVLSKRIGAKTTYLTHISHQLGLHSEVEAQLPEGVHLAYDGLEIEL